MLPPQFSIGLTRHEAAGTNTPYISSFHNRSCLQESWQVTQASVAEKYFKSCKFEGVERCLSLHGNSILGKCAMRVIVNHYFTTFFGCPDQYLGDLKLYSWSFSFLFFLKEINFFQWYLDRKQATNGLLIQSCLGWIGKFFRHLQVGLPGNPSREQSEPHWGNRLCHLDGNHTWICICGY